MDQKYIDLNNSINEYLIAQMKIELEIEKKNPELARIMRRITSVNAEMLIKISGLDEELKKFWQEREVLAYGL